MSFGDLVKHPAVQKILKKDAGTPTADNSSGAAIATSIQRIYPWIVADWRMNIRQRLTQLVPKDVSDSLGIRCLDLASVLFKCTDCKDLMWYHDAFTHDCFVGEADANALGKMGAEDDVKKLGWGSHDNVEYSPLARRPLRQLLQILKSDAELNTTFSRDLDKLELQFESSSSTGRLCGWRAVVRLFALHPPAELSHGFGVDFGHRQEA